MITGKRVYFVVFLFLLLAAYVMRADAGDCRGKSCDPLPVTLPEQATRNPHYPTGTPIPNPTDVLPSPTTRPLHATPTRQLAKDKEPTRVMATRMQPTQTTTPLSTHVYGDFQPCYPVTNSDVALLIEAVAEGYTIVIVRDVLATSNDNVVVIGGE
jgi:hypothetical protein